MGPILGCVDVFFSFGLKKAILLKIAYSLRRSFHLFCGVVINLLLFICKKQTNDNLALTGGRRLFVNMPNIQV